MSLHNNAFLLERYAKSLHHKLNGAVLEQCVSTSLTDIYFLFSNEYCLHVSWFEGHTLFLQPNGLHFPNKNILAQFKTLINLGVREVHPNQYDRSFSIEFTNNTALIFEVFGRRARIYLVENNAVIDSFKAEISEIKHRPHDAIVPNLMGSEEEVLKNNPFLTEDLISILAVKGFFEEGVDRKKIWQSFDDFVAETDLQITKPENQTYGLSVSSDDLIVETYSNTLNAFHEFGRLFLTQNRSEHLKNELLAPLLKEKKLLEGKISKTEKSLKMQKNKEDYQQLGDLLMANLHQIKRNTEQVKLLNFYTNQEVSIALKRDLSPQDNAARYYKKAKNVHLDFQHRRGLLTTYNADILKVEAQIEQVAETLSHKELLKLTKTATQEKSATELKKTMPYRSFEKEGFEIWLGKNSKGNDEVLHRGKSNDMWLHAREVAGSHVLIRNPEGKTIPKTVLEYAAIIAAANSKNKSNTLVPVIYTERKYVRKFKGALPGQVKVDRESVVMVDPREFLS